MPVWLEYRVVHHRKFKIAGQLLGDPHGVSRAFTMWADALSYARENLTDGWVPDHFLLECSYESTAKQVANVLANPRVGLWHRKRGGWQIHDYADYNRKASEVKAIQAGNRARQARYRERLKGGSGHV